MSSRLTLTSISHLEATGSALSPPSPGSGTSLLYVAHKPVVTVGPVDAVNMVARIAKSLVDHRRVVHTDAVRELGGVLAADRVLELLECELEGGVALEPLLDRGDAVDHRRVVALEELAQVRKRRVQQPATQVHGDLARQGDVPAAPP